MNEVDALRHELALIKKRLDEMEKAADRDPFLPLFNRRAFVRESTRHISQNRLGAEPSSLVYFDLNYLKKINDTYGHVAGDAVLYHFAEMLASHAGDGDHVGRLGGDEFGMLLNRATRELAVQKAEALAEALRNSPLVWSGQTIPISFSYGTFEVRSGDSAEIAMARADEAMYAQKRACKAAE
jgi:diguanylate cyclase (GGDEF)-like protein